MQSCLFLRIASVLTLLHGIAHLTLRKNLRNLRILYVSLRVASCFRPLGLIPTIKRSADYTDFF
jgi:hypothetical protein